MRRYAGIAATGPIYLPACAKAKKLSPRFIGAYHEDRFLPLRQSHSISFERHLINDFDSKPIEPTKKPPTQGEKSSPKVPANNSDSQLTNRLPSLLVIGITIVGLLILTGGFFLSPPIGTLALVLAGTSDELAGPWVLRRYRRSQKIRSKQLEKFGIREIVLFKAKPGNSNASHAIKVRAKDLGGKVFRRNIILHAGDDPQPFVDEIDIRYE